MKRRSSCILTLLVLSMTESKIRDAIQDLRSLDAFGSRYDSKSLGEDWLLLGIFTSHSPKNCTLKKE